MNKEEQEKLTKEASQRQFEKIEKDAPMKTIIIYKRTYKDGTVLFWDKGERGFMLTKKCIEKHKKTLKKGDLGGALGFLLDL